MAKKSKKQRKPPTPPPEPSSSSSEEGESSSSDAETEEEVEDAPTTIDEQSPKRVKTQHNSTPVDNEPNQPLQVGENGKIEDGSKPNFYGSGKGLVVAGVW